MNFLWVTKDTFHSYWYGPRGPRYIKRCSGIHWTLWRFCAPRLNQNCFLKIRQFWLILAHQTSKFPLWPLGTCQKWEKKSVQKATVAMPTWENLNVCTSPDSNVLMQDQWSLYLIENGCCGYVSGNLLSI